jgi:ethanolamine kinase
LNNPIPCYDYVVGDSEESDEFQDLKNVVKEIVPAWKHTLDDQISVKIICGGITNRLYRLIWGDQSVLV